MIAVCKTRDTSHRFSETNSVLFQPLYSIETSPSVFLIRVNTFNCMTDIIQGFCRFRRFLNFFFTRSVDGQAIVLSRILLIEEDYDTSYRARCADVRVEFFQCYRCHIQLMVGLFLEFSLDYHF
jgi:hypothetical protein